MLKLIFRAIFATALLSAFASAQSTTTVTGVIRDLSQAVVTSGQVTFELRPSLDSTISGFARFFPSTITCSINQATAGASGAVRATNSVTISGLTGHTFVANDVITVTGMTDSTFNGTFTIGSTTATSITYPQTAGNATTGSGVIAALRSTPGPGSCTVTMNTALNPSGTSYRVCIQPNFISPGSCFNDYAVTATKDLTTVVPTPTTSPAFTFVDLHSSQTVDGNKTFTGNTSFTGSLSLGALSLSSLSVSGLSTLNGGTLNGSYAGNPTLSGNVSVGGALGATGLTSLKNLEGIRFAADFAVGSTTCGITEAYAALPSTGGEIVLQQGNCSAAGWPVTIQKPILLVGQGMGGPNDAGTNATVVAGSSLTNTSTASSFFILSLAAQSSLEGVTFRDFAMIGNKTIGGATAGDCVDINGGTTAQQVRAIKFDNVQCNQPKISGFVIQDGAFIIEFNNTHVDQSGSHCYVLQNGPNSGVNSQIHFIASVGDLCGGSNASFLPGTADGWHISGSTSRSVDITDSTLADSANGVNVVTGATGTNVHITNSDFETNTVADVNLNDGYGHTIIGSTLLGSGAATGRGVLTAMPVGANFTQNQLMMFANNISGHATQDVTIGANQHICTILPQAQNNYTFSDASLTCVKIDSDSTGALIIKTLTGLLPSTAANGSLGSAAAPWNNSFLFGFQSWNEGTAPSATTGTDKCYADSTAHALECSYNNGTFFRIPQIIGSGTATMTTAGITTGACGTTVTVAATGVLTTDIINISHNAAVTIGNGGGLTLNSWPTAGNVNFNYCNSAAGTITPTAMTVNWSVAR